MENNKKIRDVKVFTKDGELWVSYCTGKSEDLRERPMYNEKGELDPEVSIILEKAKQFSEVSEEETEETEIDAKNENEVKKEAETEERTAKLPVVVPVKGGEVTVYKAPENAELEQGFWDKYGRLIGFGLAGILIGATIMGLSKGCKKDEKTVILPKPDGNNDSTVEQEIESEETVETIKYITKDEYTSGVKNFCDSLNTNYGFNYQPSQLTSFYYMANMENISDELFVELVNEGYIPDTVSKLLANTFEVTGNVRTKNLQTGISNIDYDKLFVDKEMAQVAEDWEEKYNSLAGADLESTTTTLSELEDFVVVSPDKGYNELPTGGREIFNWTVGESIYTKAEFTGAEATEALKTEMNDMTTVMVVYNDEFNCVLDESEKQLTK